MSTATRQGAHRVETTRSAAARAPVQQVNGLGLLHRAGALTGVLLAICLAAAYLAARPMPVAGTPPRQVLAYLAGNSNGLELSWFLVSGPSLLLGPWFLGFVAWTLWEAPRSDRPLVAAGFTSGAVAGALLASASVTWGLLVYLGPQITNASLVLVLAEARHFAEGAVCFPLAGAIASFTVAARRSRAGWAFVGPIGVAAVGLLVANGVWDYLADGVVGPVGPTSLAATLAWLVAAGASLSASSSPPSPATGLSRRHLIR